MAFAPSTQVEVRTTGSDGNAGGFCPGSGGTDYTQQPTAQFTGTDLHTATGSGTNPVVISATHNFIATDVGNCININGATLWTSGVYQIISVAGNNATLDRPCATVSLASGATWNEGGALRTPGYGAGVLNNTSGGGIMFIQSGVYYITSATQNIPNGCVSIPVGTLGNQTQLYGYGTVRGDNAVKPQIVASNNINTFILVNTQGNDTFVENLLVDGGLLASGTGIKLGGNGRIAGCVVQNCSMGLNLGASAESVAYFTEIKGCSGVGSAATGGSFVGCVSHDNSEVGLQLSNTGSHAYFCISANNSGTTSDGFSIGNIPCNLFNCISVGNGRHGFNVTPIAGAQTFVNCIATSHMSGYGFTQSQSGDGIWMLNCAGYNNSGQGDINTTVIMSGNYINFMSLTSTPFNNRLSGDFSLNNVQGAGALLRAGGAPSSGLAMPYVVTQPALDIGAIQTSGAISPSHSQPTIGFGQTAGLPNSILGPQGLQGM